MLTEKRHYGAKGNKINALKGCDQDCASVPKRTSMGECNYEEREVTDGDCDMTCVADGISSAGLSTQCTCTAPKLNRGENDDN